MRAYARFRGADLPHAVGVDVDGALRRADGHAGHLSHGPYLDLAPGAYTAAFYVRREPASALGEVEMDVCCDSGARQIARRTIAADEIRVSIPGLLNLDFEIDANARACEVRLRVPEDFIVEIRDLVIFRREPTNWGVA